MQIDLHYYGLAVLARAGGFNEADALTIAYASQYVDDATESEPIHVGELNFEPVRTAHSGLGAFNWSVQKRILIPFHFIPPNPIRRPEDTFITSPGSKFARMVWDQACSEPDERSRLIRMGIALHTYADTWSHKWFSGRWNRENDVEAIHIYQKGRWKDLKLENIFLDIKPQIGHAEAGAYPDKAQTRWKYRRNGKKRLSERNNSEAFLKAFQKIHGLLAAVEKNSSAEVIPWKNIAPRIRTLFMHATDDLEKRCKKWQTTFAALFQNNPYQYDIYQWREKALNPDAREEVRWDDCSQREFGRMKFKYHKDFYNSDWVRFHRGALKQRHFVLEHFI